MIHKREIGLKILQFPSPFINFRNSFHSVAIAILYIKHIHDIYTDVRM